MLRSRVLFARFRVTRVISARNPSEPSCWIISSGSHSLHAWQENRQRLTTERDLSTFKALNVERSLSPPAPEATHSSKTFITVRAGAAPARTMQGRVTSQKPREHSSTHELADRGGCKRVSQNKASHCPFSDDTIPVKESVRSSVSRYSEESIPRRNVVLIYWKMLPRGTRLTPTNM